jgi:hypothetical protein
MAMTGSVLSSEHSLSAQIVTDPMPADPQLPDDTSNN